MNDLLEKILNELDIDSKNGLASEENISAMSAYQHLFFTQAKNKIGVDAVYFLRDENGTAKIPLIYFSMLNACNDAEVAKLHCASWNMGEAPLLFVVTPAELRIYDNYKTPRTIDGSLDPDAGLIDAISLITDLETQRQKLLPYNRTLLESGDYWIRSKERFEVNARVDATLIVNLRVMRRDLIDMIKSRLTEEQQTIDVVPIVHGLLSRSILIKYLEARKDSNGESVFPKDFYAQFGKGNVKYTQYTDILDDKTATYELFGVLEKKFNGDMLPLAANEIDVITENDLRKLKSFLLGNSDLEPRSAGKK
jgi:hypothetical protein